MEPSAQHLFEFRRMLKCHDDDRQWLWDIIVSSLLEWQAKRVPFHDFDWEHAVGTKLHAEGLERGDSKFTAAEVRERTDKAAKQVVDDLYKVHKTHGAEWIKDRIPHRSSTQAGSSGQMSCLSVAVLIMAIVCGLLAVFAASSSSSPCSPASAEERQSFRLIIDEFEPGTLLVPDLGKEIASATGNDVVRSKSIEIKRETTYIQQLLLPYLECVQDFVQDESPDLSQNWKSYLPVGNAFSDYMSRSTSTIEKIEKRRHALTKAVERLARMISTLKTHLPATVPLDNSQSLSDDLAAKTRYLTNALDKLGIANNGLKHSLARVGHQIQSNRAPSTGTDKHRHLDTDAMVERVHELRDLKSEVRENLVRALSSAKKRDLWLFYADEEQRRANAQQPLRPGVLVTKGRRGRTN